MLQNEVCQVPSNNLTQGHQNLVHILPMIYQSNQKRLVSLQCCFAFDFEQGDLVGRKDPVISINWVDHYISLYSIIVKNTLLLYLLIASASLFVTNCLFFLRFLLRFFVFLSSGLCSEVLFTSLDCFDPAFALLKRLIIVFGNFHSYERNIQLLKK